MILPGLKMPPARSLVYEEVQSLPAMTSNSAPYGQISASTENNPIDWPAYAAFAQDGTDTTWLAAGNSVPQWIQRFTPAPIMVWKYRLQVWQQSQAPVTWQMEGSNDGSSWATLDTRSSVPEWSNLEMREYEINPSLLGKYSYHRLYITARGSPTSNVRIAEIELLQVK